MRGNNPVGYLTQLGVRQDQTKLIVTAWGVRIYSGVLQGSTAVTVKEVKFQSDEVKKQFLNEVRVLRQTNSAQTMKLINYQVDADRGYIVMNECSDTLRGKLKKGAIEVSEALSLFRDILIGYNQLRVNLGYLHNDIKPEHIFICNGHAKLGGFSVACKQRDRASFYPESANLRTFLYKAPEVVKNHKYSQKSDVWSLAVLFYEMLVGETEAERLKHGFTSLLYLNFSSAACLMAIITPCLQEEPSKRCTFTSFMEKVKMKEIELRFQKEDIERMQRSLKLRETIENECRFVQLMEYLRRLVGKSLGQEMAMRLDYLLEYNTRMRLQQATYSLQGLQDIYLKKSLMDKLEILSCCHSYPLVPPPRADDADRLNFFTNNTDFTFSESLLWQTQADLKDSIGVVLKLMRNKVSEKEVEKSQGVWRVLDFLVSWFVLNKLSIEQEGDLEQFASHSHLQDILANPTRVTVSSCSELIRKADNLDIR